MTSNKKRVSFSDSCLLTSKRWSLRIASGNTFSLLLSPTKPSLSRSALCSIPSFVLSFSLSSRSQVERWTSRMTPNSGPCGTRTRKSFSCNLPSRTRALIDEEDQDLLPLRASCYRPHQGRPRTCPLHPCHPPDPWWAWFHLPLNSTPCPLRHQ